jgi:hypothetical protein
MQYAFDHYLANLAQTLSLNDLSLDQSNQCFLLFDDKLLINIAFNPSSFVATLTSKLCSVGEQKISRVYPKLLESNLLWKDTNGAIFGLQQFSEMILLTQYIPIHRYDYGHFEKALELFIDSVEYWSSHIESLTI